MSNATENSALHHTNKLYFKIHSPIKKMLNTKNISQYYSFYCIFNQINAASVSMRGFCKESKNLTEPKFLNRTFE